MTYIENKLKHEINFFRLSKEYEKLGKDLPKGVSVSLPSESDMYTWDAVIEGPEDSLYKGITLVSFDCRFEETQYLHIIL